jgi:nucleoid DNA-binding protein
LSDGCVFTICNDYGITRQYIFKLAKSDAGKEIEQNINEIKPEFTKRVNEIIDKILQRIDYELENGDKITLSQLSTTLGILYDKSRLENNLSTSNNAININIKVEK